MSQCQRHGRIGGANRVLESCPTGANSENKSMCRWLVEVAIHTMVCVVCDSGHCTLLFSSASLSCSASSSCSLAFNGGWKVWGVGEFGGGAPGTGTLWNTSHYPKLGMYTHRHKKGVQSLHICAVNNANVLHTAMHMNAHTTTPPPNLCQMSMPTW